LLAVHFSASASPVALIITLFFQAPVRELQIAAEPVIACSLK
jgi:hypothetical protein